jgi:hypothetical protein
MTVSLAEVLAASANCPGIGYSPVSTLIVSG